ncbi:VWA domain-containing protein [Paenibacillus thiaminolyticus]|uniref:vWA domain-containing protein n=1 Tax=Paenibacillus thiaminolyticus TaxID=49283 RepID=UPI0023500FAE|nr:vWA domain-containing protein [Paenibacillus thiaminolyticus]WCR25761.1 VWA domain-containing protein [Paenibacillus thiaminolyticus]
MKQILLITDGCSNVGVQPAVAAAEARERGISVNVVGIVDYGTIGELGAREIDEIARAGGGISRIVQSHQLSQTVQMMTRKTVVQTIHQAVNKELRQIFGAEQNVEFETLPPEQRSEVVRVMDELSENSPLRVALLIDASASMKPKFPAVEEAIRDLMLSLQARTGKSELSVFHFPGPYGGEEAVMDMEWTDDISRVKRLFQRLNMRGTTPTGPALLKVIDYYQYDGGKANQECDLASDASDGTGTDGMWSDYIV